MKARSHECLTRSDERFFKIDKNIPFLYENPKTKKKIIIVKREQGRLKINYK